MSYEYIVLIIIVASLYIFCFFLTRSLNKQILDLKNDLIYRQNCQYQINQSLRADDGIINTRSVTLCLFALLLIVLGIISIWCKEFRLFSWLTIGGANTYLIIVLFLSAYRSDTKARTGTDPRTYDCLFPSRTAGVLLVPSLFLALVFGFAGLYIDLDTNALSQNIETPIKAIHFSLVTMLTLGSGIEACVDYARMLVIGQLSSGVLLFFCIFPLLITRLSDF